MHYDGERSITDYYRVKISKYNLSGKISERNRNKIRSYKDSMFSPSRKCIQENARAIGHIHIAISICGDNANEVPLKESPKSTKCILELSHTQHV
jgi:hypothetical protein